MRQGRITVMWGAMLVRGNGRLRDLVVCILSYVSNRQSIHCCMMGYLSIIPMCAGVDGKTGVWMRQRIITGVSVDGQGGHITDEVGLRF